NPPELIERHRAVEMLELRDGLVLLEFRLPEGFAQRRQHTGHRLPFDDREAGFGQARRAADQHHREDEGGDSIEPSPDGALAAFEGVHAVPCREWRGPYRRSPDGQAAHDPRKSLPRT